MYRSRVIPCLLLSDSGLVKTVKFATPTYVGDPINAVRIYNDKEVDELVLLDISATRANREPPFEMVREIAAECFMPLTYGGGVRSIEQMDRLFSSGVEKVCLNTEVIRTPQLVEKAALRFGTQSVMVSIDVRKNWLGRYRVWSDGGRRDSGLDPVEHAKRMVDLGAGEILVQSIDRDGTMAGYDLDLVRQITSNVSVPVVACGGAGKLEDLSKVVHDAGAAAAAAGSLFVFHGKHRAVLISYPTQRELAAVMA